LIDHGRGRIIPPRKALLMTFSAAILSKTGWSLAVGLLLLPALAMQFTPEMNWGLEDFMAAALIIGGIGLGLEGAARLSGKARTMVALAALATGLLVRVELAVVIVGPG
jgi:hypothetical protein